MVTKGTFLAKGAFLAPGPFNALDKIKEEKVALQIPPSFISPFMHSQWMKDLEKL